VKTIVIKSEAQRAMLRRVVADRAEAARRGMRQSDAEAALAADHGRRLPERIGPVRIGRHGPSGRFGRARA
jgi:hypothetical protein